MAKGFFKRNWLYIALLSFILAVNIIPRLYEKEAPREEVQVEAKVDEEESPTLFVDFEEAQERSKRIENILKENLPLYLFYISVNMLILFIFVLGVVIIGFFIFNKFKKREVIKRISSVSPPSWGMSDVFRMIILALAFSYIFFIALGFLIGFLESATKSKFAFYDSENFRMTFDTIVLDFIVLLIILRFLWNVYKKRLASLGFVKEHMGRSILYGVCGYIAVIPVIFIIGILVYIVLNMLKLKPPPQPIVGLFLAEENMALILFSSMIAAIFGPIIEEIFFRGVMYNAVKRRLGVFGAIFITSALFSFLHTHAMSFFLVGFIPIMILGAVLAYLYEKTGSLVPSITLHILNNMGSVFMVFVFKYFNKLT